MFGNDPNVTVLCPRCDSVLTLNHMAWHCPDTRIADSPPDNKLRRLGWPRVGRQEEDLEVLRALVALRQRVAESQSA